MTTRRITPIELLLAAAAVLLVVVLVLRAGHGHHASVVANPVRTPGVVNPNVTQENIRSTICKRGWTSTVRPPVAYTNALKRRQMPAYAETGSLSAYQEDHLISLELGGDPTDPRNLWPEPFLDALGAPRVERPETSEAEAEPLLGEPGSPTVVLFAPPLG